MFVCHVSLSRNCSTKIYVVMGYAAFCFLVSIYPLKKWSLHLFHLFWLYCVLQLHTISGGKPQKNSARWRFAHTHSSPVNDLERCRNVYHTKLIFTLVSHLFTAALSELENLSQHIPKEILLNQDNIQLSNFIGEGDEIEWNLMCLSCSVLGLRSSLSDLGS